MEFETNIPLVPRGKVSVETEEGLETVDKTLWDILSGDAREIGQGAGGELWADYSTRLQTRHLVLRPSSNGNGYDIEILSGSRASRMADVVVMFMAVAAVWGVSKSMQPGASAIWTVVFIVAAVIAGLVLSLSTGKTFGVTKAPEIIRKIETKYKK